MIAVCIATFGIIYSVARFSLGKSICLMLIVGYLWGITRANITSPASYFWFDSSVLAIYAAQLRKPNPIGDPARNSHIQLWVFLLILWPTILAFVPGDPILFRLVGLRGNIILLPFILLGARLRGQDLQEVGACLACLNIVALAFALGEYFLGVQTFFPMNDRTTIIYMSQDVGEHYYRIPASFNQAHVYGGTMAMTIPFLFGCWVQPHAGRAKKWLYTAGMLAAILGVMLSATRLNFVLLAVVLIAANTMVRLHAGYRAAFIVLMLITAFVVAKNDRMQRFTQLSTRSMSDRAGETANANFFPLIIKYPMGNGLAGGGTSIPAFVSSVRSLMLFENEYARVLLEQGIIGLLLTVAFIAWFATRRPPPANETESSDPSWRAARRVAKVAALAYLTAGSIGVGILAMTPQAVLMLICIGWSCSSAPWIAIRQKEVRMATPKRFRLLWPRRLPA